MDGYGFGVPTARPSYRAAEDLPMPGPRQLAVAQRLMYGHSSLSAPAGTVEGLGPPPVRREPASLSKRAMGVVESGIAYRQRVAERRAKPTLQLSTVTFGLPM